jgi:glycosyltransferase involved in cell wall biosynthesis
MNGNTFMKKKVAISIVTVCLNCEKTIAKTIESVREQKLREVEYIIIDGDSHDKTRDIIRTYGDVIDVFVSEQDKGISDAFNKGIAKSTGEIVGLLNADDQFLPGTIDKVLDFFRHNSDTDILHGDVLLYERERLVKRIRPARFWWLPWRLVLFSHPATFVRKAVYERWGGYRNDYRIAMDVERFAFWEKKGCHISHLPVPLARMASGGMSGRSGYLAVSEKRRALLDHGYNRLLVELQHITGLFLQWILSRRISTAQRKASRSIEAAHFRNKKTFVDDSLTRQ